jgi:hypothetical protein
MTGVLLARALRCRLRPPRILAFVAVVILHFAGFPGSAHAEVSVKGDVDAVRIEAHDSSLAEVLSALGAAFDVRYGSSIDLNRPVTGRLNGPLPRVISRLLQDYNYVARSSPAGDIEAIFIFSAAQTTAKAVPAAAGSFQHQTEAAIVLGTYSSHRPPWRPFNYSRVAQPGSAGRARPPAWSRRPSY